MRFYHCNKKSQLSHYSFSVMIFSLVRSFVRFCSPFVSLSFAIYMKIVAHNVKHLLLVANENNMKKCSNKLLQRIVKRAQEKLHCIHINHVCAPKNHRKKKLFRQTFLFHFLALSLSLCLVSFHFVFTFVSWKSNLFFSRLLSRSMRDAEYIWNIRYQI